MITLMQIDKSGREIFEKDYSIALIKDKTKVYGVNIPQDIKDKLMHLFNTNQLKIKSISTKKDKTRFRIRVHTTIIILLIKKVIEEGKNIDDVNIQICNDIDGHFHEIKEMIYAHISRIVPTLKKEDIIQAKFSKSSMVDISAKNIREKTKESKNYNLLKLNLEELLNIIKK